MNLFNSAKSGLLWTLVDNVFLKGFTFLVMVALARLLSPEDFGLIGIMSIFIVLGTAIVEGGMGNSIIRDNKADVTDFSSVFYGNLLISFFIYGILFSIAPFIASYFEKEILIQLIRIYSLSFIFSALFNIQYNVLVRDMMFKNIALYNIPPTIFSSTIGVTMAYIGYGVWSLVFMQLSGMILKIVIYWSKSTWYPKVKISYTKLKRHFKFGYKLMISSLLNSLMIEVYSFVIGKQFSVSTLGYYNHAKTLKNYPLAVLTKIISTVTYPMLSKIQEDKDKVSKTYGTILRTIFFVISPIMFCLMIIAKPLFIILFTEKWLPAVPYFQILVFSAMLTPIHSFNINVFKIYDRTDLFLKLEVVKVFMVAISILSGIFFGIYGLLIAMTITSFLALFVNTLYSGKLINYTTIDQLRDMLPVFLIGLLVSGVNFYLMLILHGFNNISKVILTVVFFTVSYIGLSYLLNKKSLLDVKNIFVNVLNIGVNK